MSVLTRMKIVKVLIAASEVLFVLNYMNYDGYYQVGSWSEQEVRWQKGLRLLEWVYKTLGKVSSRRDVQPGVFWAARWGSGMVDITLNSNLQCALW